MNNLEKKSFYSFLSLYVISSILFIFLSAYWYFTAQKNLLESNQYYKLEHIADMISRAIIHAHMKNIELHLPEVDKSVHISLIGVNENVEYSSIIKEFKQIKRSYFEDENHHNVLVSDAPQDHLGIKYVIVKSDVLFLHVEKLKKDVLLIVLLSISVIIALAFILSRLFMRPIRQKIKQIEDFVHDTAHELNTPITALSMSVSRALKKEAYDEKILKNISISTKQLFDIYNTLSYLSFESKQEEATVLDVCSVLTKSIEYYKELAQSKKIEVIVECEDFNYKIDEVKLTMLFGNLINNAIKYSHANSKIEISFINGIFKIKDFGIGIQADKLTKIYERFNRETEYAGGFGIGLSIVKKISEEYGMKVKVESEINEGSCFIIDFS